jgi:hypothetical protein
VRFRRCTSENPEPDAFVFDSSQVCKSSDCSIWIQSQSHTTVEQVLGRIVGGISDERLRIDDQPRLTLCSNYIACVQVGRQQRAFGCSARQLLKQLQTFADQPHIGPLLDLGQRLVRPKLCQS